MSQARGLRAGTPPAWSRGGPENAATTFVRTVMPGEDTSIADAAAPALALAVHAGNTHVQPDAEGLHDRMVQELRAFQASLRGLRLDPEIEQAAHYVVCATVDDIILNTPWGLYSIWGTQGMGSTFHREVVSGERFFTLTDDIQREPDRYDKLIDLVHICLSLGFQGRLRGDPRGASQHTRLRETLYGLIRRRRDAPERALSPHWRGAQARHRPISAQVPAWTIGAAAAVVLTLALMGYRFSISAEGDEAASLIASLGAAGLAGPAQAQTQAQTYVPASPAQTAPVPQTDQQLTRLREGLRRDCPTARVDLIADPSAITVRLLDTGLFGPGSATLQARFAPVVRCIARIVEQERGAVTITGHTDNTPIRTLRFPSNWELSQARAETVAGMMAPLLTDRRRLTFEGRADGVPITANTTPEDRERNRRIDVMLTRDQGAW
jgi:type VI secretion system protein ImpK